MEGASVKKEKVVDMDKETVSSTVGSSLTTSTGNKVGSGP